MPVEASHVQLLEYEKEVIPYMNWMMEDLFCRYGVSIPYFILDFSFPDYSARPDWVSPYIPELPEFYFPWISSAWPEWLPTNGFNFGSDWGKWGYDLTWFNELLGLLFDKAGLPRWQLPDFSPESIRRLNSLIPFLYEQKERNVSVGEDISITEYVTVRNAITFTCEAGDNELYRDNQGGNGGDTSTYILAQIEYNTNPRYVTYEQTYPEVFFQASSNPPHWNDYTIVSDAVFLTFDTSTLSGKTITSATLRVYIVENSTGIPPTAAINLYEHAYGTLGSEDWSGGTFISTHTSDEIIHEWNTFTIPVARINQTGNTQFRLSFKLEEDGDFPPEPAGDNSINNYRFSVGAGKAGTPNKAQLIVEYT